MIRTMLGASTIHRPAVKARLEKGLSSTSGVRSYVRGVLSEDGKSITPLGSQDEQATLSDANAFIAVPEGEGDVPAGAEVTVVVLERRYI
jgi:molybdopterin biosynthesis enzyme